jgi:serine/threonine-protein kinase
VTPEVARAAIAALPSFAPDPRGGIELDAERVSVGRAYLLAGRVDEAVSWLERATRACNLVRFPVAATRARLWLGEAREAKGDRAGACADYAAVVRRWGGAKPRSVTAEEASRRAAALGCPRTN